MPRSRRRRVRPRSVLARRARRSTGRPPGSIARRAIPSAAERRCSQNPSQPASGAGAAGEQVEQFGFGSEVEPRVEPGRLVVLPVAAPRAGWDEAFAQAGDDQAMLMPDELDSRFDAEEWTW